MTSLEPVVGGGLVTRKSISHGGTVGVRGVIRWSRGVIYGGGFTVGRSRGIICMSGLLVRWGRGAVLCLVSRLIRASQEKVGEDGG